MEDTCGWITFFLFIFVNYHLDFDLHFVLGKTTDGFIKVVNKALP